jgi:hypothetical protein
VRFVVKHDASEGFGEILEPEASFLLDQGAQRIDVRVVALPDRPAVETTLRFTAAVFPEQWADEDGEIDPEETLHALSLGDLFEPFAAVSGEIVVERPASH